MRTNINTSFAIVRSPQSAALLIRLAAIVLVVTFPTSAKLFAQGTSGAVTLQGGIDHSDLLPPVPDDLKAGAIYKDGTLKTPQPEAASTPPTGGLDNQRFVNSEWYQVPEWLAGTWPRQTVTRYYRLDYKTDAVDNTPVTHTDISISDFGYLPDSKGDIWDTTMRIDTIRSDFGPSIGYSRITSNKIVGSSDNQIIMESKGTLTVVDKGTHKILNTHQCEAIRTMTLVRDGVISEDASQKDFDEDGHPLFLEKTKFVSTRSAAFNPRTGMSNKHLVWLFGQFLLYNYWNDLVPGYYQANSDTTSTSP
jgi:hypothetical protein